MFFLLNPQRILTTSSSITPYIRHNSTDADGVNSQRKTWDTQDNRHFFAVTVEITQNTDFPNADFDVMGDFTPVILIKDKDGSYRHNGEEDAYGVMQEVLYGNAATVCSTPGDESNILHISKGETRTLTYGVVIDEQAAQVRRENNRTARYRYYVRQCRSINRNPHGNRKPACKNQAGCRALLHRAIHRQGDKTNPENTRMYRQKPSEQRSGAVEMLGSKANSFVMTVNAAEITKDNPISVGLGEGGMSFAQKDNGMEYYIDLPLSVTGEHIKSVTYSVDNDAIAVHCRKDNNPVIDGDVVSESIDTLFDVKCIEDDQKALETATENDRQSDFEKHAEEEILNRYEGKKYTSITLAYNNQNPDGCAIGIVGKRTNEPVPDDESLEAKANRLDTIIGNTLYCTVVFNDGTEQKQSIQIGATVTNFGTAHTESFNHLTEEEKALKDYTDVFVTYSITE